MKQNLQVFLLILILIACDSANNSENTKAKLIIKDSKLSDLKPTNTDFSQAIDKIKDYLIKLNVPIDSMYFVCVDSISRDHWEFRIIDYNNYLIQAEFEAETERIDSLEKQGVTEYNIYIPPTGNWGGYDRTLVYSSIKAEIISDLVDQ